MIKKISFSSLIALITTILVFSVVLAGSTLDRGQLEGVPPVGEANYTAWLTDFVVDNGAPEEVMTEDAYNSGTGPDLGYALQSIGIGWRIQVRNFEAKPRDGDPVSMIFGGLGASSGKLWTYSFVWDDDVSITDHPLVSLAASSGEACPSITGLAYTGPDKTITFSDRPNAYYHIYISTLFSGADNQLSNGRYQYLDSVFTDEFGVESYIDNEPLQSWYIVIRADVSTGDLIGCHSEEANPTNVRMLSFTATYDAQKSAAVLEWETADEMNIIGFDIYRGTNEDFNDSEKLNQEEMILAKNPGSPFGNTYTYDDYDVEAGETYSYWIEIIGTDFNRENVGPESVVIPSNVEEFYYYLPVMIN